MMNKQRFNNINAMFAAIWIEIIVLIFFIMLAIYFLRMQHVSQGNLTQANRLRYESFLLADQLRQSSDDLTRMVRSYVATGDERFETYFWNILAIRNGEKPRPSHYERVYWDFMTVTNPQAPFETEQAVSLETLMKEAGFTAEEFQLLAESKKKSDKLVSMEEIAMHAMKGKFQDDQGNYTVSGDPDPDMAIGIVFGEAYHQAKKEIMEPINAFFEAIDQRTSRNVNEAASRAKRYHTSLTGVFCLLILSGGLLLLTVKRHHDLELEAREQSEARLKEAQRISRMGNWELDLLSNSLTWSDEIFRIFEIDPAEFKASYEAFVENIHPDDRELVDRYYRDSLKHHTPYEVDHRLLMKDGRIKYVHEQGRTDYNEQGHPVRSMGIVQDITTQKQIEVEQKNAEREKAKLEKQLRRAQKMEALGTLTAGIAHDFNNILFPIMGNAEMLSDDIAEENPQRELVDDIYKGAQRARDLVKQLLAFSRETEQELKPLKVHLVVGEVLKLTKSSLPSTIEVRQHMDKECGTVLADITQMHQILMNLITNAYHAMEDAGGVLEVGLTEVELYPEDITDPVMSPGRYACLTVSDTGKGIDPKCIDRIFDPYFTTKVRGKGTGLGLSIVHGIIKSYRGDIKVYSELNKGTVFKIFLPVIESDADRTPALEPFESLKGTEKVLIVDDEPEILKMEKKMLERLGYRVTAKNDSREALDTFLEDPKRFDVVISDMTMPGMTGDVFACRLLEIRPDIPIIICSGFTSKMNDEKAKSMGIRGFIMKPVIKREVVRAIRQAVDMEATAIGK